VTPFRDCHTLLVERWDGDDEVLVGLNFSGRPAQLRTKLRDGTWGRVLDSAAAEWLGPGTPTAPELVVEGEAILTFAAHSVAVFALRTDSMTNR